MQSHQPIINVLLIGPRGCGKTTLGRAAAAALSRSFVDLDDVTLGQFDQPTITGVWDKHGEQAWRRAEVKALMRVLEAGGQIMALGGGTPTIPQAAALIKQEKQRGRTRCIYLHCDASELAQRLRAAEGDRPSLTGARPADEIAAVLHQREPTYRALADNVLDMTAMSPEQSTDAIIAIVQRWDIGNGAGPH